MPPNPALGRLRQYDSLHLGSAESAARLQYHRRNSPDHSADVFIDSRGLRIPSFSFRSIFDYDSRVLEFIPSSGHLA